MKLRSKTKSDKKNYSCKKKEYRINHFEGQISLSLGEQ